jgi:signal transduction histidine kinase
MTTAKRKQAKTQKRRPGQTVKDLLDDVRAASIRLSGRLDDALNLAQIDRGNYERAIERMVSAQSMLNERVRSLITVVEHCTRLLKEKETLAAALAESEAMRKLAQAASRYQMQTGSTLAAAQPWLRNSDVEEANRFMAPPPVVSDVIREIPSDAIPECLCGYCTGLSR